MKKHNQVALLQAIFDTHLDAPTSERLSRAEPLARLTRNLVERGMLPPTILTLEKQIREWVSAQKKGSMQSHEIRDGATTRQQREAPFFEQWYQLAMLLLRVDGSLECRGGGTFYAKPQ